MLKNRLLFTALALQTVVACSLIEENPEPAPPPAPESAPAPVPAPVVDDLPYRPLPQIRPAPKPRTAPATSAKPAKSTTKPPRTVTEAEANAEDAASTAKKESTPAATHKPAPPPAKKTAAPILNGPDWLQYCSYKQQSGDAILCDANTLLAQPSGKVQVYVREAALARDTPSGRIVLREGLPNLYRFFVIP